MSYKHNLQCFTPERKLPPATVYRNLEKRVVRIVPAADMYILLADDPATTAPTSTTGCLLKANQEYFIDCGKYNFLLADVDTGNVFLLAQEGMSRY